MQRLRALLGDLQWITLSLVAVLAVVVIVITAKLDGNNTRRELQQSQETHRQMLQNNAEHILTINKLLDQQFTLLRERQSKGLAAIDELGRDRYYGSDARRDLAELRRRLTVLEAATQPTTKPTVTP